MRGNRKVFKRKLKKKSCKQDGAMRGNRKVLKLVVVVFPRCAFEQIILQIHSPACCNGWTLNSAPRWATGLPKYLYLHTHRCHKNVWQRSWVRGSWQRSWVRTSISSSSLQPECSKRPYQVPLWRLDCCGRRVGGPPP